MEKLINKFLDLSKSVEFHYQLSMKDKMELFNYCDYIGKVDFYIVFLNERITLNKLMFGLSKENSGKGRNVPTKKYLKDSKQINTFTYKSMSKRQYHIERKKAYKIIDNIKYLHSYKKNLNVYFLDNNLYSNNESLIKRIVAELNNIDEFIRKNKP